MLLVCRHDPSESSIPLRILSIETGEVLRDFRQPIRPGVSVDIIEQFNERLMLKQEGFPLHIVDLLTDRTVKVKDAFFSTPSAFIFLYEHQTFLAFKDNQVGRRGSGGVKGGGKGGRGWGVDGGVMGPRRS